jgi:voltage-gated potassium channel
VPTEDSRLEQLRKTIRDQFATRRHSALLAVIIAALLLSFVTWSMLRGVLRQKAVTGETISMSISVYLLLAFTWSLPYLVIFLLQPGAFSIAGQPAPIPGHPADIQPLLPTLGYFSLITLSTVGYGDITPLTMRARFAAAAEGITG